MQTFATGMAGHKVVSREEKLAARRELLIREKESTRLRDQLNAKRRRLPWVKIAKPYVFEGPDGKAVKAREISYNRVSRPKEKGDTDESCKGCT